MSKSAVSRLVTTAFALCISVAMSVDAYALDFLPDLFRKDEVTGTVWELNEQYVRLVRIEDDAPPNDHPVALDKVEVEQALASLQLWIEGGVFRDEEASALYPSKQAAKIANYVTEALGRAAPNEDVTFNVRGYVDVLLSMGKEREWTTGRVFYRDGKLNLIIGEYAKRIDKAKKTVEGSFGITDDFRDVHFQTGSRDNRGKMPGRVVTTAGVELASEDRPDWIIIDVAKAALAYRDAAVPSAVRKEERKAKQEAARLTLERRQMREEMARMRKELQELQSGQGAAAGAASVEERLTRLQRLHEKGLISDEDFARRKDEILGEI